MESTPPRKQQILQALAMELEQRPGDRITTARLAQQLALSEAALYRHFPSKAAMFEGLIVFAEDTVYSLIARIMEEEVGTSGRCQRILGMVLMFSERNPGISRVLLGDALIGEHESLRLRTGQFFERLEAQIRQILREADLGSGERASAPPSSVASLLVALVEGRIARFVRSDFKHLPAEDWEQHWGLLHCALFAGR
ncbi:MAG: nucleoid occlusion factor SlmA [Gammaproteobacteria bacterium]|nr:nucleoid occlusion factor SlmA [Gammaproteobacteria bacterium]